MQGPQIPLFISLKFQILGLETKEVQSQNRDAMHIFEPKIIVWNSTESDHPITVNCKTPKTSLPFGNLIRLCDKITHHKNVTWNHHPAHTLSYSSNKLVHYRQKKALIHSQIEVSSHAHVAIMAEHAVSQLSQSLPQLCI